jgi:hypothetical protein
MLRYHRAAIKAFCGGMERLAGLAMCRFNRAAQQSPFDCHPNPLANSTHRLPPFRTNDDDRAKL